MLEFALIILAAGCSGCTLASELIRRRRALHIPTLAMLLLLGLLTAPLAHRRHADRVALLA